MGAAVDIRRASADAVRLFDTVADDVFDGPIEHDRLRLFLADHRHLMVIGMSAGQIVGQARAVIHLSPDQPDELYVDNLGVAPAFQRRGVGRRLVRELLNWGRELDCNYAWLGSAPDNVAACALYADLGARELPMIMFEFESL